MGCVMIGAISCIDLLTERRQLQDGRTDGYDQLLIFLIKYSFIKNKKAQVN